ncbi:SAM-dependent methyltransferase [Oceanidesulfovibrio marinus]|uniref:SAM-dependent methyltransferase n=2 Tax=Oceanidesulfovibrio marinus TaxID=370038 RepID=A0A6P1ZGS0_9BACT|nr:SAM-dependent methyltransferase [Oceanidesulfovibrio marinus]
MGERMMEQLNSLRRRKQHARWEEALAQRGFYGQEASPFCSWALEHMEAARPGVLELGAGQGRDALELAEHGYEVTALDYAAPGLQHLAVEAGRLGLTGRVVTVRHNVLEPLPFEDGSFGAVYAHMLLCMDFGPADVTALLYEVRRVLALDGVFLFSVRTSLDHACGLGRHMRGTMYDVDGFHIRFYSREMVRACAGGGLALEALDHLQEGEQPMDLHVACLRRTSAEWDPSAEQRLQEAFAEAQCDSGRLDEKDTAG